MFLSAITTRIAETKEIHQVLQLALLDAIRAIQGINPFSQYTFTNSKGSTITYPVYSWVYDNGRNNIGTCIEQAAKAAAR
ncbi:hypothetical protein LC653_43490 [Nostoc sp. CHAB 5784]|uniref:hypothetical protein n=1 Tax=Nostoc mirabile TaxID=2907820 RepID=UPI001E593049|nr:hypothetical protein [Nostoc mirabile]MCC5670465.1 hypothetical protein [Nostoc mirabile CHAB5784]